VAHRLLRTWWCTSWVFACLGGALSSTVAHANPEVPLLYDARSTAMGGTGAAFLRSAAAAEHNPALLSFVENVVVTATFTPYALKLEAPFKFSRGPQQVQSGIIFGPFAQLAMAARLHERVVMGIGAYLTSAAGGQYDNIPLQSLSNVVRLQAIVGNARIGTFAGELQIPVSVQVTPRVSLAAAYRVTYAQAFADITDVLQHPLSHAQLSGNNFTGFQLGVLALVHPQVHIGLTYRNNVTLAMHGTLTKPSARLGSVVEALPPELYVSPHQGRFAVSWRLLQERLRLAGDVRYWLFHAADASLQNAMGVQLGAEYRLPHNLAARLGYSFGLSATTPEAAVPVGTPPGIGHGLTCGCGTRWGPLEADLAFGYLTNYSKVAASAVRLAQSAPGTYYARGFFGGLSVHYRL
jgi:long-subunit fatty acid transport protein